MGIFFISLLTLVLILISLFVVLIVLMQKTSQSGGMGAALGGGAAESAFGSETTNILTKGTILGIIAFFVVALVLFLLYQSQISERETAVDPAALAVDEASPAPAGAPESPEPGTIAPAPVSEEAGETPADADTDAVEAEAVDAVDAAPGDD